MRKEVWKTSRHKIKGFSSYQRKFIRHRAGHRCQFPMVPTQTQTQCCGSTEDLECHHIYPRSYAYKVLKWNIFVVNDIENGVLICRKHHSWLHKNNRWRDYIKYFCNLAKRG